MMPVGNYEIDNCQSSLDRGEGFYTESKLELRRRWARQTREISHEVSEPGLNFNL